MVVKSIGWLVWGLCLLMPGMAAAAVPPDCTEAMLADAVHPNGVSFGPDAAKVKWLPTGNSLELPFEPPVLQYPYGSLDVYGFDLNFVVSAKGTVECASIEPAYRSTGPAINAVRYRFLEEMSEWQIKPFLVDGKPVRVASHLDINEVELPQAHVPKPDGDPAQVTITQDNWPWLASYNSYHVELHGDGMAIYTPHDPYDPLGPQTYHVDPKALQSLIDEAEKLDFWSLRNEYLSPNSMDEEWLTMDRVNITLGGVTKSLTSNNGEQKGLSPKARNFQSSVLAVARIDFWQTPTLATLDQLKINGFDFQSKRAGRLLLKMMQNGGVKDEVVTAVMDMGAPLDAVDRGETLLEAALGNGRMAIANRLITGGALLTDGKSDQLKVNWALYAAIATCRTDMIDLLLPFKPDLTYLDYGDDDAEVPVSVIRKLGGDRIYARDCIPAAQRLIELGGEVNAHNADGSTLLHEFGLSLEFARFLVDKGANVNALTSDGRTPLGVTYDEDVALLFLDHGADPRLGNAGRNLRFNIKNNHWDRVKTWLVAHGYNDVLADHPEDEKEDETVIVGAIAPKADYKPRNEQSRA